MKKRNLPKICKLFFGQLAVFFLLLLTFSLFWAIKNFGNIGLNEIIFTLHMPLKNASAGFLADYFWKAAVPSVVLFASELFVTVNPFHWKRAEFQMPVPVFLCIAGVWFAALFFVANGQFGILSYVKSQMAESTLIEEEYVSPDEVQIRFPKEKRNLICIYVESLESSMQDVANGGIFETNYIPELTELAKESVSFSQSEKIEGAAVAPASGWTIAGLVAETAGLPLKLFEYNDRGTDNAMSRYEYFLPGAVTLGDILEREGYQNYIMFGSKAEFGGRRTYFKQHGNYEIWDYDSAVSEGRISSDYYVNWGFEDQKLYQYAKEKLLELADEDRPFCFSMLTADMHTPAGYRCRLCPDRYEEQYGNVLACASAQLSDFVKWLKQQEFYENTSILICGDHCSMVADFFGKNSYDKHNGETVRKVYNAFLNSAASPVQEKNRRFTTMDLFPTVIASLGGTIEGDRLGIGTNLFSGEQTLAEKYGYETLFEELNKRSTFYDNKILYP